MIKKFLLDIVSPEALVVSKEVVMLVAPGSEGDLGILAEHAPLISALREGELRIYEFDDREYVSLFVTGGFLEVAHNRCTVLGENISETAILKQAENV